MFFFQIHLTVPFLKEKPCISHSKIFKFQDIEVLEVTIMDGRDMGALVPGCFDAILLDAPCSCEGNIRKE